jgi:hypothetical protein
MADTPIDVGATVATCGGTKWVRGQDEQTIEQSAQPSSGHPDSLAHFSAQSSSISSAIHAGAPLIAKTSASAIRWTNRGTRMVYSVHLRMAAIDK